MPPPHAQQRNRTQGYARDDRGAAGRLQRAGRVAEHHDPGHRADQRLEVEEGPGQLGGDAALPVGEQRERDQRPSHRQGHGGDDRAWRVWHRRQAFGHRRVGQRGQGRPEELHGGDRDRVSPLQQPGLAHGERGRDQQRDQDQAVAEHGRATAVAAGDQANPGQRDPEACPGHRPGHGPVPDRGDHRDQDRHRTDQQRGMGHAGQRDPGVLEHHRSAVTGRTRQQHQRRGRPPRGRRPDRTARSVCSGLGPRAAPADQHQQDRGGQAEPGHGQPAGRQPGQGQLGQRHGRAPQHPGQGQGGDSWTAVRVHTFMGTNCFRLVGLLTLSAK
jgi:hypothetical protein